MKSVAESLEALERWRREKLGDRLYCLDSPLAFDGEVHGWFEARAREGKNGKIVATGDAAEEALHKLCEALGIGHE